MEKENPTSGVVLQHLKGKFALTNYDGKLVKNFELSKNQAQAIYDYLNFGTFKGMFDILSLKDYIDVLAVHYDCLIADTQNREMRSFLNKEFEHKAEKLKQFYSEESKEERQPM